jgi:hypothetical protein
MVVNYELECKIRSLGAAIEVLEPEILRNKIMNELQQTLLLYSKE